MNGDSALPLIVGALLSVVLLLIVVAGYVVYAAALSRLFSRSGVESWRGWVPILNVAEVLRLGGVARVMLLFFFVPIANIYALYLLAIAANRIGQRQGRGAGSVVLAIVLPPVWAALLAWGRQAELPDFERQQFDSRASNGFGVPATGPLAEPQVQEHAAARDVIPAAAPMLAPTLSSFAPPPQMIAPVPQFHVAEPGPAEPAGPVEPGLAAPALIIHNPWADPAERGESPQVASAAPGILVGAAPSGAIGIDSDNDSGNGDRGDDEEYLDTVVVDRHPRREWELVLETGATYPLASATVALGRKPEGTDPAVQYLAVSDTTRTLSKHHAILRLEQNVWTITDLSSTNGVILVDSDGQEHPLAPASPAPIADRGFRLGSVSMTLRRTGEQ